VVAVEVRHDTEAALVEGSSDAADTADFNPELVQDGQRDDRGEEMELLEHSIGEVLPLEDLSAGEEAGSTGEVRPSIGDVRPAYGMETAWVHAARIGAHETFELVDPYVWSRFDSQASYVAIFFSRYSFEGREVECDGHITICKCRISREQFEQGVPRAEAVVTSLRATARSSHWRGRAVFRPEYSKEHYALSDLLVQSPLPRTCFAVMHAMSPRCPRREFHISFNSSHLGASGTKSPQWPIPRRNLSPTGIGLLSVGSDSCGIGCGISQSTY